jgi:hypothetical protein
MIELVNEEKTYVVRIKDVEYILITRKKYKWDEHKKFYQVFYKKDWDMGFLDEVEDWLKEEVVAYQSQCF